MWAVFSSIFSVAADAFRRRRDLEAELLALRHQVLVLNRRRGQHRVQLRPADRVIWVLLSRFWSGWRNALIVVKPETVIAWHRRGFRCYWRWKSRTPRQGRPKLAREVVALIQTMHEANPTWGAPRIRRELLKLGFELAESTVSKLLPRKRRPPSQTWKTFLHNHFAQMVAVDFAVVPTVSGTLLFVFVVLSLARRRVLHVNVTAHPTAHWTAQQLVEAIPWTSPARYLVRDRDGIYGSALQKRVEGLGLVEVPIAPRSPWQNGHVERFIGSLRRECLDHIVAINERQLLLVVRSFVAYYNRTRTHLALGKEPPEPRAVFGPDVGHVVALPEVGGLHHRYERREAA